MTFKKTKIICTIGPSVSTVEKICELIEAGMDAARLNFSHGTHEIHKQYMKNIREAAKIKKKNYCNYSGFIRTKNSCRKSRKRIY